VTIKVWDEQGVKEYRKRLEKATFEEQEVQKMAAELKKVVEKATNEVVKALREWRRNKIDRSRFLEMKRRYTERERCREKKKQKREW
jgi:asparagine synthetase A